MKATSAAQTIDPDSPAPIPSQLRTLWLAEVKRGGFTPGGRFPSERELAERHGVSRASVREAVAELIRAGVLMRQGGRGTFLSERPPIPDGKQVRTNQVGFLIDEDILRFVDSGVNRILAGVEERFRRESYHVLFHTIAGNGGVDSRGTLVSGGTPVVDGCVVTGGVRGGALDQIRQLGLPLVLVDPLIAEEDADIATVKIDYAAGTRLAIENLVELGHEEIGFIGFPNSEKYRAYWRSLEAFKSRYNPHVVEFLPVIDMQPGIAAGYEAARRMVDRGKLPSALLATNDLVARGAMEALQVSGVRVPGEVSVVGYDDLGVRTSPPLTTITVDLAEVGRLAAQALLDKISGRTSDQTGIVVPVGLVVRGSTGPRAPK